MMPARKHLLNLCILLKSNAGVVIDGIKTVSDIDAVVLGGNAMLHMHSFRVRITLRYFLF
jgi:hypothetical protein